MTEAFVKACADKEALEQERGDSNQKTALGFLTRVRCWHFSDIPPALTNVCFQG